MLPDQCLHITVTWSGDRGEARDSIQISPCPDAGNIGIKVFLQDTCSKRRIRTSREDGGTGRVEPAQVLVARMDEPFLFRIDLRKDRFRVLTLIRVPDPPERFPHGIQPERTPEVCTGPGREVAICRDGIRRTGR